jgi:hypothetical protein
MAKQSDLAGQKFGRLTALESLGFDVKSKGYAWKCRCDCGTETRVLAGNLISGNSKSCGCWNRLVQVQGNVKHGHAMRVGGKTRFTPTYSTWRSMLRRCHNPRQASFQRYGAKGISMTKPWRDSFESFLNDMGERPPGMTIDRIDNRFGYFMANCRWATTKQQEANKTWRLKGFGGPRVERSV